MSRTWLLEVLDRSLPDKVGAERDRLADEILDALPLESIGKAIHETAFQQLQRHCIAAGEAHETARDVAGNAAMAVVGVLGDIDDEEGVTT